MTGPMFVQTKDKSGSPVGLLKQMCNDGQGGQSEIIYNCGWYEINYEETPWSFPKQGGFTAFARISMKDQYNTTALKEG